MEGRGQLAVLAASLAQIPAQPAQLYIYTVRLSPPPHHTTHLEFSVLPPRLPGSSLTECKVLKVLNSAPRGSGSQGLVSWGPTQSSSPADEQTICLIWSWTN